MRVDNIWLVVTGTWILFSIQFARIIPLDFHIFQRGWNNNQYSNNHGWFIVISSDFVSDSNYRCVTKCITT